MRRWVDETDYDCEIAQQFCNEVYDQGFEPYHYHGRFYWEGPAVNVEDLLNDCKFSMQVQSDSMGLGYVVYPVRACKLKEK